VTMRYLPDTIMLLIETILLPMAYWAQAAGFEGDSPEAAEAFTRNSGTHSVAGFIYLGWSVYMWIITTVWGPGSSLRKERMQGSLESLFLTPVSRFTLLFGPSTTQLVPAAAQFVAVGLVMRFVFGVPLGPGQILAGVLVVIASIPLLFALGSLVAISVLRVRDSGGVNSAVRGLVAILCGITYPVAVLPEWVHPISHALPITTILDTLRSAVLGSPAFADVWSRVVLLLVLGAALGGAAIALLHLTMRSVRRAGSLAQF
jgi:ABC-2 type transport system permease protein